MDYTKAGLGFKIKKSLRYISLYGLSRTIVKIKGQYHMKKEYKSLPAVPATTKAQQHVGLLGCGNFGFSNIAYYLNKNFGKVLRATMDININRAASVFEEYKASYYTNDAQKLINDPNIDLLYIASNHASHAEYAIQALQNNKSVHIEKPHAVTIDQLLRLCSVMQKSKGKVRLGFNRPNSKLGQIIKKQLLAEQGTAMLNWFVAGHDIEKEHWYFAPAEGGRVLGNLCHWTDLVYNMINGTKFPITIIPTRAQKSDCDISVSYVFGEGSIATITFSAKGHTFEGVRETLNAHKGNSLIELKDFQKLRIDHIEEVKKINLARRDHGHQFAIVNSYKMLQNPKFEESVEYVWNTGYLALKTKEALETNSTVIIDDFENSFALERSKIN